MAYGKVRGITKPLGDLPARIYPIGSNASEAKAAILTIPFDFAAGEELDEGLARQLWKDFNEEVEDGRTYPQEDNLDFETYKGYFLSYDLVLGLFLSKEQLASLQASTTATEIPTTGIPLSRETLATIKLGETTKLRAHAQSNPSHTVTLPNPSDTYAFTYYIKPNYPGRSSHLCNGGFIVPSSSRGLGLGRIAARSFCFYAPACGYRGSVFNLVYASNEASVKLWTKLGFTNVGRIPEAGRLRTGKGDGVEEEYVDAWVVHGDFAKIGWKDEV